MNFVKFCPYCTLIAFPRYTNEEFECAKGKGDNLDKFNKMSLLREIDYYNDICPDCHNHLETTTILADEYCKNINYNFNINYDDREIENGEVYETINKQILEDYIKPLRKIDSTTEEYKENMLWQFHVNLYAIDAPDHSPTPSSILMAQQMAKNKPKCPTCSSTNIEKISSFDKAAGAVMFGFFSKTARSQFKCRNCGYKW